VFAETADCAVGDAWLPDWIDDHRGNSIIIVRNHLLLDLIKGGFANGQLNLQNLNANDARESQRGGLLHRNEGLALRLHDDDLAERWRPRRRTQPSAKISGYRKHIYRTRVLLREASHVAFQEAKTEGNIGLLYSRLLPLIERLNHRSLWRRALEKLILTIRQR
jgi:coenzyme F420 hydrogenase subunit beta